MERTAKKHSPGDSKYRTEYARMAYEIALMCKASDKDLARIFDVSPGTIQNWKKGYPDFVYELERGKDAADSKVAVALIQRCLGYSHPDTHISNYKGVITKTELVKHYPPDTAAIKFWLTNRQKEHWSDTSRVENQTNVHVTREVNLKDIPTDQLKLMKEIGMRELLRKQASKN